MSVMDLVLRNALLVLEDEVVSGSVSIVDGRIDAIDGGVTSVGEDLHGDWLLPGLVELHTDHLESHYLPRPAVRWPMTAAVQAHDAQVASAGMTTVLDCLRIGRDGENEFEPGEVRALADALTSSQQKGALRAEHLLHLRCEVSAASALEDLADFVDEPAVRLVSLMDHTPGERQFTSLQQASDFYCRKRGFTEQQFLTLAEERGRNSKLHARHHRITISALCRERGIRLASHDDATAAHVDEAIGYGVDVAEFPTTRKAAAHARAAGLKVLMGAPNVVRGQSHTGNVAASSLARDGLLDILSSDYVPISLLQAVFMLVDAPVAMPLPAAVGLASGHPADAAGLTDRGRIAPGLRADLVQVHRPADGATPVVRQVWRGGRRVV